LGWSVDDTPWPFYPEEIKVVPVLKEEECAPAPVLTEAENFSLTGIRTPDRLTRSSVAIPTEISRTDGVLIYSAFYYINPNKMHTLQSLFYLTTALYVSGVTITHLQEHKTTAATASGNRYTVIDRVKLTDSEYR
jgi:hypothetical protein